MTFSEVYHTDLLTRLMYIALQNVSHKLSLAETKVAAAENEVGHTVMNIRSA